MVHGQLLVFAVEMYPPNNRAHPGENLAQRVIEAALVDYISALLELHNRHKRIKADKRVRPIGVIQGDLIEIRRFIGRPSYWGQVLAEIADINPRKYLMAFNDLDNMLPGELIKYKGFDAIPVLNMKYGL